MYIKINNITKIIEDFSDNIFDNLEENYYQIMTEYKFEPLPDKGVWQHIEGHKFDLVGFKDSNKLKDNEYFYNDFITLIINKGLLHRLQYQENEEYYYLWFIDSNVKSYCNINKLYNYVEKNDFENNYKNNCNKTIEIIDSGTGHTITKPRPVEARYFQNNIYFKTGINEIDSGDCTFWTINTSTPGITIVEFTPNFGYYIEGGFLYVKPNSFIEDIKVDFILAPDIPLQYGGSHKFISNKRLRNNISDHYYNIEIITPPAYIKYYAENSYANKLQAKFIHDVNDNADIELALRLYK